MQQKAKLGEAMQGNEHTPSNPPPLKNAHTARFFYKGVEIVCRRSDDHEDFDEDKGRLYVLVDVYFRGIHLMERSNHKFYTRDYDEFHEALVKCCEGAYRIGVARMDEACSLWQERESL